MAVGVSHCAASKRHKCEWCPLQQCVRQPRQTKPELWGTQTTRPAVATGATELARAVVTYPTEHPTRTHTNAQKNSRPRLQSSKSTTPSRQPTLPLVRRNRNRSRPPHRTRPQPRRQRRHKQHGPLMQTLQRTTRTALQSQKRPSNQNTPRTRRKSVFWSKPPAPAPTVPSL